jgi:hypothetical protein
VLKEVAVVEYLRIGDLLVERGILSKEQVHDILDEQKSSGEPFGAICERLFDVSPETIEEAWASQYISITRKVNPAIETIDQKAVELVSRRQAWQFRVLPIRWDGRELMVATTPAHLRRALRFVTRFLGVPVYLVIADSRALGDALCRHYPLAGMTPASIDDGALDHLLSPRRGAVA